MAEEKEKEPSTADFYEFGGTAPVSIYWYKGASTCDTCGKVDATNWTMVVGSKDHGKELNTCGGCSHHLMSVMLRRFMRGIKGRDPEVIPAKEIAKEEEVLTGA